MPRRVNMAQTELPMSNELGVAHDPDQAYELEYGSTAANEQRRLYVEARRCTCSSAHPKRWGTRWGHRPPCPRAGRRF